MFNLFEWDKELKGQRYVLLLGGSHDGRIVVMSRDADSLVVLNGGPGQPAYPVTYVVKETRLTAFVAGDNTCTVAQTLFVGVLEESNRDSYELSSDVLKHIGKALGDVR